MNEQQVEGAIVGFAIGALAMFIVWTSGAMDNKNTWTASDMRGTVQVRLKRLDRREAKAETEWERLQIAADRAELYAILEPYGETR